MRRSPIAIEEFDASDRDVSEASTLPPACYTSPDFFEFEKDAIFFRDWLCIGRADQVPNAGDYLTVTLVDEPLVMLRDHDGEIVVLSAVCRHRAALVVEDAGNCGRSLRCPYHWWTYGLDGRLIGAPHMHDSIGFVKEEVSLPRLKVELWNGFVFVNFDDGAPPLAPRLRKFDAVLANYHADQLLSTKQFHYDMPWNWKIMLENGTEHYHAVFLHHRYLAPDSAASVVPPRLGEDDDAIVSIVPVPIKDLGISPHGGAFFPPIPTLTDEERSRFVFSAVAPNLLIGLEADYIFWFILLPVDVGSTVVKWAYCVPKNVIEMENFDRVLELVHRSVEAFNDEDFPINAGMQRGMRSRLATRGRMSVEENTTAQIAQWLVQRYRTQDARATARQRA